MIKRAIRESPLRWIGGDGVNKKVLQIVSKRDVEDDGSVFIAAVNKENAYKALKIVEAIAKDPEPGEIFFGTVTRIMNFGAFVEIAPGKEGLVHISQLDKKRVAKVEDVVSIGDTIKVIVSEIDDKGRLNLSRKDALDVVDDI
ncbi:MAG: S1 RNA-binding domain-containing protein [Ruminococcaceae bacterium]|nr:S1 RNA-binding domain-containing protein [Oscillospiraceae bacterium]